MVNKTFQGDYGAAVAPADSSPQLATWLAEAAASDGSTLTIEPGSYHWATTNAPTSGLTSATINGYGATVDALFIGCPGLITEDYAHSARIQTVGAGATSVTVLSNDGTLIAPADVTLFSVNDWIMIAGLGLQTPSGYPPNFQWTEFRKITGIVGNAIAFADSLANTYRSTWPYIDAQPVTINIGTSTLTSATSVLSEANPAVITTSGALPTGLTPGTSYFVKNLSGANFQLSLTAGGAPISLSGTQSGIHYYHANASAELAGPATIYRMLPQFDGIQIYNGLRCTAAGTAVSGGKSLTIRDMYFDGLGPGSTMGKSVIIRDTQIGTQNEVDKCLEYLEYNNCSGTGISQLLLQSALGGRMVIRNCRLTTINGTARITEITGSTITEVVRGPSYGTSQSISALNSSIGSTRLNAGAPIDPTDFTAFSSGTFTVPNISAGPVWQRAVPGNVYFFAFYDGVIHDIPDSGPRVTFTITDVRQDTTNTYVDTDIVGALPTPTFSGQATNAYFAEADMSQEFTSGSSVSEMSMPAIVYRVRAVGY